MNIVEKLKESLSSEYDFKVTKTRNFLKFGKRRFQYIYHLCEGE